MKSDIEPEITPEVAAKIKEAAARNAALRKVEEIEKLSNEGTVNAGLSSAAAKKLLETFGLSNASAEASLTIASKLVLIVAQQGVASWKQVDDALKIVVDTITVQPAKAPAPPKEEFDRQLDELVAEPKRPEFPVIPVPEAPPPPDNTNPMAAIAKSVAEFLRPMWEHEARRVTSEGISKLRPVVEYFGHEIDDIAVSAEHGPGFDPDVIRELVKESVDDGAGDLVCTRAEPVIREAIRSILENAKLSITPQKPIEEVKLSAAFEVVEDDNYKWTDQLEKISELIDKASEVSPQNAMLIGPTGCGKTAYAFEFAARFKRKIFVIDCGNVREARDWFGQKGASQGSTWFRKSQFWMAVEAGRIVILLDEFNRVPEHVKNLLFPILDHRRRTYVDEVQETLVVGPGTVFFATLNEGLDYTGTHALDRAMRNRFARRIEFTYLREEREIEVLVGKVPGLSEDDAKKLVGAATVLRSKASGFGAGLSETISTRQLLDAARDFVAIGPSSFAFTIFNHFSPDGGADSERAQVVQTFEGKFGPVI